MLSTKEIKNVSQASHYFMEKDNYYTSEAGIAASEWWGKGARSLGLIGEINKLQFNELLQGKLASGEQIGKIVNGELKHRAGWDLTFSAPKSVSLLALVGQDERLILAHQKAVRIALSQIERGCAQARIKIGQAQVYQNTGNIVASLFHHDLSRTADPQLHTHCVIFNLTERADGKWRSQASQIGRYGEATTAPINGFIERVRHNKRFYGQLYRNELAYQISQLGYSLEVDDKTGFFEISGVSKEVIKEFSQRRSDIEAYLEQNNLTGGKAASVATLKTRQSKIQVNREKLQQQWQERLLTHQFDLNPIINVSTGQKTSESNSSLLKQDSIESRALDVISKAIADISIFQSTMTLEEIITNACGYVMGDPVPIASLLHAVEMQCQRGDLITINEANNKISFMSNATLQNEKQMLAAVSNNQMTQNIIDTKQLDHFLIQQTDLELKQAQDLKTIFNQERVILIEGSQGKHELMKSAAQITKSFKINIDLISSSLAGSRNFNEQLKYKPQTLIDYLKSFWDNDNLKYYSITQYLARTNRLVKNNSLILVDNAHLLSTYQTAELIELSIKHNNKLILIGQAQSLLSEKTGIPFQQLLKNGITTITLEQQNVLSNNKKTTIEPSIRLDAIKDKIVEVKHNDERIINIAQHYVKLSSQEQQNTWVLAQDKSKTKSLNANIHNELKQNKMITKTVAVSILKPCYLPLNKMLVAASYEPGRFIRFNEKNKSIKVSPGEYCKIIKHNKMSNEVILQKQNGKHITFNPAIRHLSAGTLECFVEEKREIGRGELVVYQRSIKTLNIIKGERYFVKNTNQQRLQLQDKHGKTKIIDLTKKRNCHFDYGYATKPHHIVHEKPTHIIAEFMAQSKHSHQRNLNYLQTIAKSYWIYTDNLVNLFDTFSNKTDECLNAHEILNKSEIIKKNLNDMAHVLSKHIPNNKYQPNLNMAMDAIEYALHHVSEREAGFTHKEVLEVAMRHVLGKVSHTQLTSILLASEKAGILLRGTREDGTLWTTINAVKLEREIIQLSMQDQNKCKSLASDETLNVHLANTALKTEQQEAIRIITQNKSRIVAVQGHAGTGKTTLLKVAQDILLDCKHQVLGLAPTHTAVNELMNRGIQARTIDSFLQSAKQSYNININKSDESTRILFIDEASMISNRKMVELLRKIHKEKDRAIIIGDYRQLPAIEAGKPQSLIQKQVTTAYLTNIQRQRDPALKKAVQETIYYDFKKAFKTLKKSIVVVDRKSMANEVGKKVDGMSHEEERLFRIQKLVEKFISYPVHERNNTLIYTPGRDDRRLANLLVREQFKQEGILPYRDIECSVLVAKDLTQVERSRVTNFNKGDVLRFANGEAVGIKAGEYLTIVDIHRTYNLLTLQKKDKQIVHWQIPVYQEDAKSKVEVFYHETREIQVGDIIRWTRTNKTYDLFSASSGRVIAIAEKDITIVNSNQTCFTFNRQDPNFQHWDHSYASTGYGAQGQTKQNVLALLESHRINLINQNSFFVALTRAVDEFIIFTDNEKSLLKAIEQRSGSKQSSLEVIGENLNSKNQLNKKLDKTSESLRQVNQSSTTKVQSSKSFFDTTTIQWIKSNLNREAEKIAITLLGEPKSRTNNTLRFGSNKGSLIVTINGSKQGMWYDFAPESMLNDKAGGDILYLIRMKKDLGYREALTWGAYWLNLAPTLKPLTLEPANSTKSSSIKMYPPNQEEKSKIQFAKMLAIESIPVKGTLAERYLKEHRAIDLKNYPDDFRYHPGIYSKINEATLPALLVIARNKQNEVQAVQAIYLDSNTANKIDKSFVAVQKQSFGKISGSTVNIKGSQNESMFITEGPETGLSLAMALPDANIKITLGKANFLTVSPDKAASNIIFCLDYDGKDLKNDPLILTAATRLHSQNFKVSFMVPTPINALKQDYNDVLKAQGTQVIHNDFKRAVAIENFHGSKFIQKYQKTDQLTEHTQPIDQNYEQKKIINKTPQKGVDLEL